MLTALTNTFAKGDIQALANKLLHSTCWQQHNVKHYGEDQLRSIVQNWLATMGRSDVVASQVIKQDSQIAANLTFRHTTTNVDINYTFWLESNGEVIKSIVAMIDTPALALATGQDEATLTQMLPDADALIIADYDQQDHLQGELAIPSTISALNADLASLLDSWWSIWSKNQLAAIDTVYDANAAIKLPGNETQVNSSDLFDFVLARLTRLSRAFAQLEQVLVDGEQVAIKWYLDGDENGQRVRVPMLTMLSLEQGKIQQELTTTDILAFQKRFPHSSMFQG
ncbi:nuclear transport factor 2 family protein [Thalassotalea litorea]|uniref:Nuclear transport factor 2 family protein n=1 Tax=Thalassotalea litorea TaxID=2020715 RepID=A0A5R9IMX8_9GAMM|nr:nuclear transport factor 2 family protein [Thalassotalea litorea]TLU66904.1 nuclear transport factor 2 family protein [Thalassotalea litorea]